MDIVLSPGINHIRCSSGEGGRKEGKDCRLRRCWSGLWREGEGGLLGGLCRNIYSRGWILTAMPHLLALSSLLDSPPDDRDRPTDRAINVDAVCGSISRIMTDVKRAPETDGQTEHRRRNRPFGRSFGSGRKSISQRAWRRRGQRLRPFASRCGVQCLCLSHPAPHDTDICPVPGGKVSLSTFPSTRDKFFKKMLSQSDQK